MLRPLRLQLDLPQRVLLEQRGQHAVPRPARASRLELRHAPKHHEQPRDGRSRNPERHLSDPRTKHHLLARYIPESRRQSNSSGISQRCQSGLALPPNLHPRVPSLPPERLSNLNRHRVIRKSPSSHDNTFHPLTPSKGRPLRPRLRRLLRSPKPKDRQRHLRRRRR
jgi:hypothetical protein